MYDDEKKEKKTFKHTGSITRIVLVSLMCITAGIVFATCGVGKSSMQECKSICGTRGVMSVSQWSCQCNWTSSSNSYVIPSRKTSK